MKVAFIGLGIMGSRMAANLLKGGHNLTVHNRTAGKAEELVKQGAVWADTPAEAVKDADILVTMLENPEAVRKTAVGAEGFLSNLKEGRLWIDSSTVNPSFSAEMAALADERDIRFMDAPVSGSKEPAANAELIFLVGARKEDLQEAQALFDLMGKKTIHVGGHGKGAAMKIMINQLLGQSVLAFSESLALGMAMGIDKSTAMDILLESPVTAPILKAFRSRIEEENYEPHFPLRHLHKDMQLFTDTAYEFGRAAPLTGTAKEIYALAKQQGQADLDFCSVFNLLKP